MKPLSSWNWYFKSLWHLLMTGHWGFINAWHWAFWLQINKRSTFKLNVYVSSDSHISKTLLGFGVYKALVLLVLSLMAFASSTGRKQNIFTKILQFPIQNARKGVCKTSAYMMYQSKAWWKTYWSWFKDCCRLLWASDEDLSLPVLREKYVPDAQKHVWQSWNTTVLIVFIIAITFCPSQWNWVTAELFLLHCQYSTHSLYRDLLFENLCLVTDIGENCFWYGFSCNTSSLSKIHERFHLSYEYWYCTLAWFSSILHLIDFFFF